MKTFWSVCRCQTCDRHNGWCRHQPVGWAHRLGALDTYMYNMWNEWYGHVQVISEVKQWTGVQAWTGKLHSSIKRVETDWLLIELDWIGYPIWHFVQTIYNDRLCSKKVKSKSVLINLIIMSTMPRKEHCTSFHLWHQLIFVPSRQIEGSDFIITMHFNASFYGNISTVFFFYFWLKQSCITN